MKKKISYQSFLIVLIMIIGIFSSTSVVNAVGNATLSCSGNFKVGEKFTVTLNMPAGAFAIEATVTVKFSDGTTAVDRIGYISGLSSNSVSFTATKAGTATITATNVIISDADANETKGDPITTTINISDNVPTPPPTTPPPTTDPSNNGSNNSGSTSNQVNFTDVNETVYTTDRVNLRKSYSTSSQKITTLPKDTKLTRTGIASNGWSRVNYNGQTAYVSSQYLSKKASGASTEIPTPTENEVKFTDVKDTMYANQNCNLRKSWSTDSDRVGYLKKGDEVKRTGTSTNGWSRIEYNGQVVYVMTRLLTKEKPEENDQNVVNNENLVNNETITNEITEGEKTELQILQEEIGVLPEVGNNIATRIYFAITIITLSSSFIGLYYMKKDVR